MISCLLTQLTDDLVSVNSLTDDIMTDSSQSDDVLPN